LSVDWRYLSTNSAVITLTATNGGSNSATVDIGVAADITFGVPIPEFEYLPENAPVTSAPGGRGFTVRSPGNLLTFITSGYPFVSDVSTFWFGPDSGISTGEVWSQVEADSFTGGDSAIAFSWQGVAIGPGMQVARSVVVKFGELETSRLVLVLTSAPQGLVYAQAPMMINGVVEADPLPSGLRIQLILVVDGGDNGTVVLEKTYWVDAPFLLVLVPSELGLVDGVHEFVFYAVDEDGDVSEGNGVKVTLSRDPTRSFAPTPSDGAAKLKSGAVAGIVVGAALAVGIVVVAAAGFYFWWRRTTDEATGSLTEEATGRLLDTPQDV
jgi:hypothetical protein